MKLCSSWQIFKKFSSIIFLKFHPVGTELLHADRWTWTHGQTDMTKPLVAFAILRTGLKIRNLANYQKTMVFGNRGTSDREFPEFLGALAKLQKATVSFVLSVSPSVRPFFRTGQFGSYQKVFHEIWYLSVFRKSVKEIQVSVKYDKNNGSITLTHSLPAI